MATSSEPRATLRFPPRRAGAFVAAVVLALLMVVSGAAGGPSIVPSSTASQAPSAHLRAASVPAAAPEGPFGDRFFTSSNVTPVGAVNSASGLAVDPSTGTVYAANINAGTVTAFGETNGTLLRSAVVADVVAGSFPFALALDAANATLYVSVSNRYAGIAGASPSGWVLALDARTLAVTANYSFPTYPTPPFEPSFLAFDGPTHQLFVENASGGTVAALDVVAGALHGWIDCGVMECADHGYGLLDIPSLHDLIIPTCEPQLVVVNTTADAVVATIEGPPTTIMAWSAFDSRSGMLWVENYTFNRSNGTLLKVDLSTDQVVANIGGVEPREAAMAYDASANLLVTSDLNGSEQVSAYNATTGLRVASYSGPTGAAHPFKTLAVDPVHGLVIAGGPGNGTTRSFALPTLAPQATYGSFPASFPGVGADPGTGSAVLVGAAPNVLWVVNESTGATTAVVSLPANSTPSGLAVDPTSDRAYVADAATGTVGVYQLPQGTSLGTIAPLRVGPIPGMLVAVDPDHHLLYMTVPTAHEVAVASLATGSLLGTVPVPGVAACALTADPNADSAFVANCGGVGNVTQVNGATLGRVGVTGVSPNPSALVTNTTGAVFVLDNTGTHVTVLNATATEAGPAGGWALPDRRATTLAVDDTDGLLFASGGAGATMSVYATAPGSFGGELALRAPSGGLAFDPVREIVVSAELYAGGAGEYAIVATPAAPTGLVVTPQNNSLAMNWNPPSDTGAGPVISYRVTVGGGNAPPVSGNVELTEYGVGGLRDGSPYVVRVASTSYFGTGPSTAGVVATPAGVPYPPTNLAVVGDSSTSVALTWQAPTIDDGASVTAYSVIAIAGSHQQGITVGANLSATIGGLTPGTAYRLEVVAGNMVGAGHPSNIVEVVLPPGPPSFPIELVVGLLGVGIGVVAVVALMARRRSRNLPDDGPGP